MSLVIDTGAGHEAEAFCVGNYTSNVSPMWTHALGVPDRPCFNEDGSPRMASRLVDGEWERFHLHDHGLRVLHGAPCSEAAGVVARAVERMEADPDFYRQWEPENGWGDYEGALAYLRRLRDGCQENPAASICVYS